MSKAADRARQFSASWRGAAALGYGSTDNIGDDELPSSVGPIAVTTTPGVTVKQLAAGDFHTCALLSDGRGHNDFGQLGNGNTKNVGDDELPSSVGAVQLDE